MVMATNHSYLLNAPRNRQASRAYALLAQAIARFDDKMIIGTNPVTEWRNAGYGVV